MMAAAMAQALNNHDHLKRSMDMPLFFGLKEKDTITARHLIERIERAPVIATWNAELTCNKLYMILREKALVWYESLADDDLDLKDWDVVKKEFLKNCEPKYSARTTCANFADLTQKPGESINNYHVRVQTAYKRLTDSKPATMAAVRLAGATVDQAKAEEMADMAKLF
jgi:Retrotransposon gag protein